MKINTRLLLIAALFALVLPILFTGTASAMYMSDGAVPNPSGGFIAPSDGICVIALHTDGTMDVDTTITNKRDCDAKLIAVTAVTASDTLANVCGNTTLNTAGVKYAAPGSSQCVTIDGSGYITGSYSMANLDRNAAICSSLGGQLGNATAGSFPGVTVATKTTAKADKSAVCAYYGWQYRGQNGSGTPLGTVNTVPTPNTYTSDSTGFCYAGMRTNLAAASCPTVAGSTSGTANSSSSAAFGYSVSGTACVYAYGITGTVDKAVVKIDGTNLCAAGAACDLSTLTTLGACLANGGSWSQWIPQQNAKGTNTTGALNGITTAVSFDLTRQAVNADEGCLHCHSSSVQQNGPAERWKDSYLKTGHKNMLRKVIPGNVLTDPDGVAYVNDGTASHTINWSDTPQPTYLSDGVNPIAFYYVWGDWMAAAPSLASSAGTYGCGACHTGGFNDATNPGVQSIGTPGYLGNQPADAGAGYVAAVTSGHKWDIEGIQCSRCHNATVPSVVAAQITASSFPTTAPTSGGMGALASGTGRNNLCFGCHQSIAKSWPAQGGASGGTTQYDPTLIPTGVNHGASVGRDFNGHVLGNSFLNSVHAKYAGTNSNSANGGIKLNSLGKYDLFDPNGTTEYGSIFKGYTCWQSGSTNSPAKTKADGTEIKTKAECDALYGGMVSVVLTNNGTSGCTAPTSATAVTFGSAGCTTAPTATAKVSSGTLAVTITNVGAGCTSAPTVTLPATTGCSTTPAATAYVEPWRADQDGSLAATSVQGTCTTCHDVHNSLFVEGQAEAAIRKTCEDCHVNNATTGATDALAPQKNMATMSHPTGAGTPFDTNRYESSCVVCHMATQAEANGDQNSMPVHVWRINTSASYNTFPTADQWNGTNGAVKDRNAQTAPDGSYNKAVWVDLDLACGQCHKGDNGTVSPDLGTCSVSPKVNLTQALCTAASGTWTAMVPPVFSKTNLSAAANTLHGGGTPGTGNANCLSCHGTGVSGAPIIDPNSGATHHYVGTNSCFNCHSAIHNGAQLPGQWIAGVYQINPAYNSGTRVDTPGTGCLFCHGPASTSASTIHVTSANYANGIVPDGGTPGYSDNHHSDHGTCTQCHGAFGGEAPSNVGTSGQYGGARKYLATDGGQFCLTCHSNSGSYGRHHAVEAVVTAGMNCVTCHTPGKPGVSGVMTENNSDCLACHTSNTFTSTGGLTVRTVVQGTNHHNGTCTTCHKAEPFTNLATGNLSTVGTRAALSPMTNTIASGKITEDVITFCLTCHSVDQSRQLDSSSVPQIHPKLNTYGGINDASGNQADNHHRGHSNTPVTGGDPGLYCVGCHGSGTVSGSTWSITGSGLTTTTVSGQHGYSGGSTATSSLCMACHGVVQYNGSNAATADHHMGACVSCHQVAAVPGGAGATNQCIGGTPNAICSTQVGVGGNVSYKPGDVVAWASCTQCHDDSGSNGNGLNANHHIIPAMASWTSNSFSAPISGTCTACHADAGVPPAVTDCATCHASLTGANQIIPGVNHHGLYAPCSECHPKGGATATNAGVTYVAGPNGNAFCLTCHSNNDAGGHSAHHATFQLATRGMACTDCHAPFGGILPAGYSAADNSGCLNCHGTTNWNPAVNGSLNGGTVFNIAGSDSPGHHTGTCTSCHNEGATYLSIAAVPSSALDTQQMTVTYDATGNTACLICHSSATSSTAAIVTDGTNDNHHGMIFPIGGVPTTHAPCATCHTGVGGVSYASYRGGNDFCLTCHADYPTPGALVQGVNHHNGNCLDCHKAVTGTTANVSTNGVTGPGVIPPSADCTVCHGATPSNGVVTATPFTSHPTGSATPQANCVSCHGTNGGTLPVIADTCGACHGLTATGDPGIGGVGAHLFDASNNGVTIDDTMVADMHSAGTPQDVGTGAVCGVACHTSRSNANLSRYHHPVVAGTPGAPNVTGMCYTCHNQNGTDRNGVLPVGDQFATACGTCHGDGGTAHVFTEAQLESINVGNGKNAMTGMHTSGGTTYTTTCTDCHLGKSMTLIAVPMPDNSLGLGLHNCTDCHQPGVPVDVMDPASVDATCGHCHGVDGPGPNVTTAYLMAHIPAGGMHNTPLPTAAFGITVSGSHSMGVSLSNASKDATATACASGTCTYAWALGSGDAGTLSPSATAATPTVTYTTNGTKTITLTVTDTAFGSIATVSHTVNITRTNTAPTVTASASANTSWTATVVPVTADADGDTVTVSSVNWGDGAVTSSLTHTYSTLATGCGSTNGLGCAGTRSINVTVTDGVASVSTSTSVTLNQYVISGNAGEVGVSVALSSGPTSGSAVSGSNGAYSITVNPGTYTLTPSKTGKTFSPASSSATVGPNSSGNDFGSVTYALTVAKQLAGVTTTSGSVISSPVGISCGTDCTEPYNSGQVVVLTSTAPSGKLTTWTGCTSGGGTNLTAGVTTCSVTMSAIKNVTVNYTTPAAPTLTVTKVVAPGSTPAAGLGTVTGGGLTTASTGTGACASTVATCGPVNEVLNGSYSLAATPAAGHALKSLTDCTQNFTVVGGGTVTCTTYRQATVTMNASKTIQVNFDH